MASTKQASARPRPAGAVRIIGGRWKRTLLPVIDSPGLRPTPDRVRESLFNWLTHAFGTLERRSVLDLFAGSGALAFEAASRGAGPVIAVERDPKVVRQLKALQDRLEAKDVDIRRGDALDIARRLLRDGRRFDLVFLDPPFAAGLLAPALALAAPLCEPDGLLYVESDAVLDESRLAAEALEIYRADKAGGVFYHLLQRKKTAV